MTGDPRRSRFRDWPLAAKVMVSLALTLLPLGVFAAIVAVSNFRRLVAVQPGSGLTTTQAVGIAAPMVMWMAALLIGWVIASRLIVEPLSRMRSGVERYSSGDGSARIGSQRFFSREIADLAEAFDTMADRIATHEAELQGALNEQKRLTREVHHRVKNNLQIVSSLLSIQARETANSEVSRAYAAVQARVAALAIVHRWMYESDTPGVSQGVDLRALANDLCAALEQGLAQSEQIGVSLICDVARLSVGQDTAVPLAFLITELVSAAARRSAPDALAATVSARAVETGATLTITSDVFIGEDRLAPGTNDPASRIIHGMARQLRCPLRHDPAAGSYSMTFPLPAA